MNRTAAIFAAGILAAACVAAAPALRTWPATDFIGTNFMHAATAQAALESIAAPATTNTLGLVIPDGTTVTVDSNGVISASSGGGSTLWTVSGGDIWPNGASGSSGGWTSSGGTIYPSP